MVCTRRKVYEGVKANWKLHFENFNDSLHIPFVHGGTLNRQNVSGRARRTHEEFDGQCVVHFTQHKGSRGLLEGETGFPRIDSLEGRYQEGTWYPCILPATMMAWTIDCMFLFELWPLSLSWLGLRISGENARRRALLEGYPLFWHWRLCELRDERRAHQSNVCCRLQTRRRGYARPSSSITGKACRPTIRAR